MNICSRFHEEVVFEDRKCPVCDIIENKDREIEALTEQVNNLQSEVNDLTEAASSKGNE